MKVQVVGCSHRASSVALRERLVFDAAQAASALEDLRTRFPGTEAVLLSTCNRVELYTAVEDPHSGPSHEQIADFLAGFHGLKLDEVFDDLFERSGEEAVRHLFTVASSLDSMVVGEPQILSQVKQAYQLACEHKSDGPLTHAIFQAALKVARRVASETSLHQKRVSIPSVAVAFAKEIFERFDDKAVLVIGAGEMGEETLRYLQDEGARNVTVINRNFDKARRLAADRNGTARPWEELEALLAAADLVISTTGASEPIVTLADYRRVEQRRAQRPLFVLDLAMPRDFDPAIGERGLGVYLYSIDDLEQACRRNVEARRSELPVALAIVEEETSRFMQDLYHRATGPLIARLKQGWQQPKEDELRRLFNKLPELDDRSRAEISYAFDRLMNKLLHPPLESLRDEARAGTPHGLLDALKRLFQLKD